MKHMLKRLFSLLLALCLIMSALPANVWAEGTDGSTEPVPSAEEVYAGQIAAQQAAAEALDAGSETLLSDCLAIYNELMAINANVVADKTAGTITDEAYNTLYDAIGTVMGILGGHGFDPNAAATLEDEPTPAEAFAARIAAQKAKADALNADSANLKSEGIAIYDALKAIKSELEAALTAATITDDEYNTLIAQTDTVAKALKDLGTGAIDSITARIDALQAAAKSATAEQFGSIHNEIQEIEDELYAAYSAGWIKLDPANALEARLVFDVYSALFLRGYYPWQGTGHYFEHIDVKIRDVKFNMTTKTVNILTNAVISEETSTITASLVGATSAELSTEPGVVRTGFSEAPISDNDYRIDYDPVTEGVNADLIGANTKAKLVLDLVDTRGTEDTADDKEYKDVLVTFDTAGVMEAIWQCDSFLQYKSFVLRGYPAGLDFIPSSGSNNISAEYTRYVIPVTKVWNDESNRDGIRPASITITLIGKNEKTGEEKTYPVTLTAENAAAEDANTWFYGFENLPAQDENMNPITYTIVEGEEAKNAGYGNPVYDQPNFTVTNSYTPEKHKDISVKKEWDDQDNQDGIRPASVTVNLLANGEKLQSKTLSADNNWSCVFTDLYLKDAGQDIKYEVTEDAVEKYQTSITGSADDGFTITNSYTPETTMVTGSKIWNDDSDRDGKRPEKITVNLWANREKVQSTVVTGDGDTWNYRFDNLPKKAAGKDIIYTVTEESVPGYTTAISGTTITNSYTPATTEVSGVKIWDDANNQDGKRPDSITIYLMANGKRVDSKVVTAMDNWAFKFENLLKYQNGGNLIPYSIVEEKVEGYTTTYDANSYNVTNSYTPKQVGVSVSKVWNDEDNQDGIRPQTITINLLADGNKITSAEIGADGTWTYTFTNLPEFKDGGKRIIYTITEDPVAEYETNITRDETTGIFTVTNSHTPAVVTVSGTKTWVDNNNAYDTRPESITIHVMNGNTVVKSQTVTAEDWTWTFENLPKFEKGTEIQYAIAEDEVENYSTKINGYNVTNTLKPGETSVPVTKVWNDANDQDGKRPANVTIKLFANNVDTGKSLTVAGDDWKGTFTDLPKYDEKGVEIVYTVKEVAVTDYTTTYSEDTLTITNSYTPETIEISGTKTWDDANDQDGKRPDSIIIRLRVDGEEVASATVTEADGWSYKFTNLPKFAAGTEIQYAITEDTVKDYTTTYDGYNVTNKWTPEQTGITVTKVWEDADDQDGIRPETITINLLADGKQVRSQQISADSNWSYTFTELPVYASGVAIKYTAEEVSVEGYSTTYSKDKLTITNTHVPEVVEVAGAKTWIDNNNAYETRPETITINLLADDVKIKSVTVSADDDWEYEFTDLPKFKDGGKLIRYSITEDPVTGYDATISGYNVTNRLQPHETSVEVTKVWDDADNQDGKRPANVTVKLFANGVDTGKTLTLTGEGNNWTGIFEKLDKYDAQGVAIVYTIKEVAVADYTTTYSEDTLTITNSYTPETIEISGAKTWDDANDQDGKRPDSITIRLRADGEEVASATVTEADGWSYKFTNLPKFKAGKEIGYTITEDAVENYTTTYDGYNVTNQYTPEQTSVTVIKVWDDADDQDGIRPKNITINLMAGGEKIDSQKIKAEDGWTHTFTGLDAYANGEKIIYTITEDAVEKYDTDITGNATKGFVVTNSHTPYVVEVTGSKTWIDNNNAYETRPESITINVLADGEEVASKTVTAADGWSYKFTDLPMNKAGEEIVYTITEDTVEGYNTAISGYDVTNTLAPHETSVTVTKVWDDADNQDGKRPNGIVVNLLANGKATDKSLTLSEDTWTGTFKKLDKYDAQGVLIVYTVEEEPVEGYTTTYSEDTLTITNHYTPEIVSFSGSKTWDDKDNQDGKRPESITIRLLANGEEVASATVTEEEEWSWSFTELPKFEKGVEIIYTITEDAVEGYTPVIDGFNVTNKYTPEQTSVTVTKAWNDADDQDGMRPKKVTINLLANGKKVDSKVIDADDKWTYTFTDLDVYAKGEKIVYTVEEKAVEGYESTITGDAIKGYVVTNTHTPAVVEVSGAKTWNDDNNRDGKRPTSITVNLMADGKKVASAETSEKSGWSYKFTDLPKFNDGEEIVYTVVENAVEGYTVSYDGFNITNSYAPSKTSITVTKRWVDGQDTDRIRPNSITVVLYANGEQYQEMKLTEKESWVGVFENLPVYENGALIEYTVEEVDVRGYDSAVTGDANEGFVVTNTHIVVPKTGDESNLAMYAGFMVTSMVAMAAVLFLAKPKKGKYAR